MNPDGLSIVASLMYILTALFHVEFVVEIITLTSFSQTMVTNKTVLGLQSHRTQE